MAAYYLFPLTSCQFTWLLSLANVLTLTNYGTHSFWSYSGSWTSLVWITRKALGIKLNYFFFWKLYEVKDISPYWLHRELQLFRYCQACIGVREKGKVNTLFYSLGTCPSWCIFHALSKWFQPKAINKDQSWYLYSHVWTCWIPLQDVKVVFPRLPPSCAKW